jgi:hypothetical protein
MDLEIVLKWLLTFFSPYNLEHLVCSRLNYKEKERKGRQEGRMGGRESERESAPAQIFHWYIRRVQNIQRRYRTFKGREMSPLLILKSILVENSSRK